MTLQPVVTHVSPKLLKAFSKMCFGRLKRTQQIIFPLVQHVSRRNTYLINLLDYYGPYLFQQHLEGYFHGFHCQLTYRQWTYIIMVVVDRFSKAGHFGTLPSNFSDFKAAKHFTNIICRLHGYSKSMVSDRDPLFLSHFWKALFQLNGTKLRISTVYHPQSGCQTEAFNQYSRKYLRSFCHDNPKTLGKYINWAKYHYNTSVYTFPLAYLLAKWFTENHHPLSLLTFQGVQCRSSGPRPYHQDNILRVLQTNLSKAQKQMMKRTDKHWKESFEQVTSCTSSCNVNSQLRKRLIKSYPKSYFRHFQINKKIKTVAYKT